MDAIDRMLIREASEMLNRRHHIDLSKYDVSVCKDETTAQVTFTSIIVDKCIHAQHIYVQHIYYTDTEILQAKFSF